MREVIWYATKPMHLTSQSNVADLHQAFTAYSQPTVNKGGNLHQAFTAYSQPTVNEGGNLVCNKAHAPHFAIKRC